MAEFFYNFVVFKTDSGYFSPYWPWRHHTIYTVKSETEYTDKSFAFVASRLALAERVMLFSATAITHIVAYEHEPGKLYDAQTQTHTIVSRRLLYDGQLFGIGGARPGREIDAFYGLRWRRNRKEGKNIDGYLPACVGYDDVFNREAKGKNRGKLLLNMKGPLASRAFPFYANQLAAMPQIQDRFAIDRFGMLRDFGEITSGRLIGCATDNSRLRRRYYSPGAKTKWLETIMERAQRDMFTALRVYHGHMNDFNHLWGHHSYPPFSAGQENFRRLATLWYPLMKKFGYRDIPEQPQHIKDLWVMPVGVEVIPDGSLKWKSHGRQIDSCLRELYNCHQWLAYFFSDGGYYRWRRQVWPDDATRTALIYADWDNVTEIFFKVVDCYNVLNLILLVHDQPELRGVFGPKSRIKPPSVPMNATSYPASVPYEPFQEIYPFPREPFLTTPEPPAPIDPPPESEVIAWDSGPPEIPWDDGNDSWAYQIKEAVRTALAKLEGVRRLAGKARKLFPWYRKVPIEKIPPQNDEVLNPFDD
jgi:hypothetical protein